MVRKVTLGYYKAPRGNVGDDLNTWLWPKVFPELMFEQDNNEVFIGIGSILDSRWENFDKKYVFGAGARSLESAPLIDSSWDISFVRGPLTQNSLISKSKVPIITDPAILISDYYKKNSYSNKIGIVPYFKADMFFWKKVSEKLGFELISPLLPVDTFASKISECGYIITEAMHGAIFADALRIPWLPISQITAFNESITHNFKWTDWCASVEMNFNEIQLPQLWSNDSKLKQWTKFKLTTSKLLKVKKSQFLLSEHAIFTEKKKEIAQAIHDFKKIIG